MLSGSIRFSELETVYGFTIARMTVAQQEEPEEAIKVQLADGRGVPYDVILYRWSDGTEIIRAGRETVTKNSRSWFKVIRGLLVEVHKWRDPQ